jgi:hypothetical protein
VREEEKKDMDKLLNSGIPFKVKAPDGSTEHKVNILMQVRAYFTESLRGSMTPRLPLWSSMVSSLIRLTLWGL